MHGSVFQELSLIIAVGAAMALIMRIIRQPLIIGHILTGVIVGPSVLHLVQNPDTIETFSTIGIALLLFIIGLGLNPSVIKEVGRVSSIAGIVQVIITGLLGWGTGILFGLSRTESVFLGIALSFSSTIIILKLLSDKKEQSRLYGKIAIGILLLQDLLATIALLVVAARGSGEAFSTIELLRLTGKGLLIIVPLMLIGRLILPRFHNLIAGSQEFLFLFAIGWGFGSAALFEYVGFSLEIGALAAGIALAALPYAQEVSSRLRPLRDFFIVVFFIALGTRIDVTNFGGHLPLILASCLVVIIIKPLIVMSVMGLLGYTKRASFKTAIALGQISEFSLIFVILGYNQGLVSNELVSVLTVVALVSIAVSTYLIIYSDKIFNVLESHLSMFEQRKAHTEHAKRNFQMALFGYRKGGHEFLRVFKQLNKPFVVIDYDPEVIDILEKEKINYLYGDATDIELLYEAGLSKVKLVVSTMSDHDTNISLIKFISKINPDAVIVSHADSVVEAEELYILGASYVIMPHYIGSEKIGAFIRKNGFKKSEFKKYREKHLEYLQTHFASELEE